MYIIPDIKECASNACMNGATCNEDINKYTCTCVPGYNGVNCEEGGYLRSANISQSYVTDHECGLISVFIHIYQLILVMLTFVSYSRSRMIRMLSMSRNEC